MLQIVRLSRVIGSINVTDVTDEQLSRVIGIINVTGVAVEQNY